MRLENKCQDAFSFMADRNWILVFFFTPYSLSNKISDINTLKHWMRFIYVLCYDPTSQDFINTPTQLSLGTLPWQICNNSLLPYLIRKHGIFVLYLCC